LLVSDLKIINTKENKAKIHTHRNLAFLNRLWGIGILCAVFYFVPFSEVFAVISLTNPLWVVAGISLQILIRVLNALRMQTIANAQRLDTSYLTMIRIVFITAFYNIVAPGALVGGAVTYVKYRQQGVKSVAAVANIYANKSVEILVVSLSAPLFWLIDKDFSLSIILAYGLSMVIGFYVTFAFFFGRFGNIQWLKSKIDHHGQSVIHRTLVALCHQVVQIGQMSHRSLASLVVYSGMYSLFAAVAIICFGNALSFKVGLLPILWINPVIYLLAMLPISISNIGVREVSMIMLLAPYGVASTEATAWSLLMYSGPLCSALIGLILELEQLWFRKKDIRETDAASYQISTHHKESAERSADEDKAI
jgi:uncharacterized protein (TIRG00374 family)